VGSGTASSSHRLSLSLIAGHHLFSFNVLRTLLHVTPLQVTAVRTERFFFLTRFESFAPIVSKCVSPWLLANASQYEFDVSPFSNDYVGTVSGLFVYPLPADVFFQSEGRSPAFFLLFHLSLAPITEVSLGRIGRAFAGARGRRVSGGQHCFSPPLCVFHATGALKLAFSLVNTFESSPSRGLSVFLNSWPLFFYWDTFEREWTVFSSFSAAGFPGFQLLFYLPFLSLPAIRGPLLQSSGLFLLLHSGGFFPHRTPAHLFLGTSFLSFFLTVSPLFFLPVLGLLFIRRPRLVPPFLSPMFSGFHVTPPPLFLNQFAYSFFSFKPGMESAFALSFLGDSFPRNL